MASMQRRLLIVLAVGSVLLAAILAGGYAFWRHRKQAAVSEALSTGLAAYEAGDYSRAAANLQRYLMVDNRDIDILLKYADAQILSRPQSQFRAEQAVAAWETVLRLERGHPQASHLLSQFYLAIQAPIEAERVARAWLDTSPSDPQAKQTLAAALIAQQKLDEAATLLEEVLVLQPDRSDAASALAMLRVGHRGEDPAEVVKLLDGVVAARPDSPEAYVARARFYVAARDLKAAREDALKARSLNPADPATMLNVAGLLGDVGLHTDAMAAFERAAEMAPDKPDAHLLQGRYVMRIGDVEAGVGVADRALAAPLKQMRLDVLPMAAQLYAAAGRAAEARGCVEELRKEDPNSTALPFLDALALLAEGDSTRGVQVLQDLVRRTPRHAQAHLALARAYANSGLLTQAAVSYEEYLRVAESPWVSPQLELARLYARMGQWNRAVRTAVDAERRAPNHAAALITSLEVQGFVAQPGGPEPDAIRMAELHDRVRRLAEAVPEDPRLPILLARYEAWRGSPDKAVALLEPLRERPEVRAAATAALLDVYVLAERYEDAIRECRAAIDAAEPRQRPTLQVRLAEIYAAAGRNDEATGIAQALAAGGDAAGASAAIGSMAGLLIRQGHVDQARQLLRDAIAANDREMSLRLLLLSILPADASSPSRQELVDQVRRIEGESGVQWRLWQARIDLEGDTWQADAGKIEALLNDCLTANPNLAQALSLLGLLYERLDRPSQALGMYQRATQVDDSDMGVVRRYLEVANRLERWADVDAALAALPKDAADVEPYRIEQALRRGDTADAQRRLQARIAADAEDVSSRLHLAQLKRVTGEPSEARRLLDEAAAIAPDSADVLQAQVAFHVAAGEHDAALALCNQAIERAAAPETYALRASVHSVRKDLPAAEQDLRRLASEPEWAERGYLALGQLYMRYGETARAVSAWREALAAIPDSFPIRQALATTLLSGGESQRQEGAQLLGALLQERPDDPTLRLMHASTRQATNPAEAERICEEVARQNPTMAEAYVQLARMAMASGRNDRALERVEQGLVGSPQSLELLLLKAELLRADSPGRSLAAAREAEAIARHNLSLRPYDETAALAIAKAQSIMEGSAVAAQHLEQLLATPGATSSFAARLNLARLHLSAKDFDRADELIRRLAEEAPEDPRVHELRLHWFAGQGQWEPMAAYVDQRLEQTPRPDAALLLVAGRYLAGSGEPRWIEKAVALFEEASRQRPDDIPLLTDLGSLQYRLGRIDRAKATFTQALQKQPGNIGLINNLAWILCEHDKDPNGAQTLMADLLVSSTDATEYPSLLDTWGVVQYRLGLQAPEAAQYLEESRRRLEECLRHPRTPAPTRAAAAFHLARTLVQVDAGQGQRVLEELLADEARAGLLSQADREEAQQLLEQVRERSRSAAAAGTRS